MRSPKQTLVLICSAAAVAASLGACSTYGDTAYGYDTPRSACERARSNNRVAGTVAGAAIGALAGSAIAGNSSNTAGTVAGGVIGGVIGNQAAKGRPCPDGYYRYDQYGNPY
jgi:uncharacterized protein YcfJ